MATTNAIRPLQAGPGGTGAGRIGRGDRRGADRSAAACGQRDRLRRQGRPVREHRRTVECVSGCRIASRRSPARTRVRLLEIAGGIWRFDENKLGQKQSDGKRYATGVRQMPGLTLARTTRCGSTMHNRDGLDTLWPGQFTAEQNAEWPRSGVPVEGREGSNFGWPYCFYNNAEGTPRDEPRIRRRRQEDRSLRVIHGADRRLPRALGAERCDCSTPARSFRRSIRAASSSRFTDRGIARRCRWRATTSRSSRSPPASPVRGRVFADGFAGKTPLMSPADAVRAAGRPRDGTRRLALHHGGREGSRLARDVHRQMKRRL